LQPLAYEVALGHSVSNLALFYLRAGDYDHALTNSSDALALLGGNVPLDEMRFAAMARRVRASAFLSTNRPSDALEDAAIAVDFWTTMDRSNFRAEPLEVAEAVLVLLKALSLTSGDADLVEIYSTFEPLMHFDLGGRHPQFSQLISDIESIIADYRTIKV
jgi:hypothetical protein